LDGIDSQGALKRPRKRKIDTAEAQLGRGKVNEPNYESSEFLSSDSRSVTLKKRRRGRDPRLRQTPKARTAAKSRRLVPRDAESGSVTLSQQSQLQNLDEESKQEQESFMDDVIY